MQKYTASMSMFVKSTPAPVAKSSETKQIAILYAGLLTLMAVTQLFTFDTFIELFSDVNLPIVLAPLIVAAEVFALPFLLRMQVSPAFRWVSMVCGWFVAAAWIIVSSIVVSFGLDVETVGFLGTLVDLSPGWWALLMSVAFAILATWASWGLWPLRRAKK